MLSGHLVHACSQKDVISSYLAMQKHTQWEVSYTVLHSPHEYSKYGVLGANILLLLVLCLDVLQLGFSLTPSSSWHLDRVVNWTESGKQLISIHASAPET